MTNVEPNTTEQVRKLKQTKIRHSDSDIDGLALFDPEVYQYECIEQDLLWIDEERSRLATQIQSLNEEYEEAIEAMNEAASVEQTQEFANKAAKIHQDRYLAKLRYENLEVLRAVIAGIRHIRTEKMHLEIDLRSEGNSERNQRPFLQAEFREFLLDAGLRETIVREILYQLDLDPQHDTNSTPPEG